MDIEKAIEIVDSLGVINVNFKGKPVWIEDVDKESNEIKVKDLKTDNEFMVNVHELTEDGDHL